MACSVKALNVAIRIGRFLVQTPLGALLVLVTQLRYMRSLRSFTWVPWGCFFSAQVIYRANHNSVDLFGFLFLQFYLYPIIQFIVFKFLSLNFSFHFSCYVYFILALAWFINLSLCFCCLPFVLLYIYIYIYIYLYTFFCSSAIWIILCFLFLTFPCF